MTDRINIEVKDSGTDKVAAQFERISRIVLGTNKELTRLQKTLGIFGSEMGSVKSEVDRANASLDKVQKTVKSTDTAIASASKTLTGFVKGYISLYTITRTAGAMIDAQKGIQQIHYGLLAATGSVSSAREEMEFLRQTSHEVGISFRNSAEQYTRLAASATAMNVATEDQRRLFTALAQASTVLHLEKDKVQWSMLALSQMFSKTKIQAEELRRQLGEHIPGVVPRFQRKVMEMVKGTELAGNSFEDMMKKGLLATDTYLPALTEALEEVGASWREASWSLTAELDRLGNAWFDFRVAMSAGIEGPFTEGVRLLADGLGWVAANADIAAGAVGLLGLAFVSKFIGPYIASTSKAIAAGETFIQQYVRGSQQAAQAEINYARAQANTAAQSARALAAQVAVRTERVAALRTTVQNTAAQTLYYHELLKVQTTATGVALVESQLALGRQKLAIQTELLRKAESGLAIATNAATGAQTAAVVATARLTGAQRAASVAVGAGTLAMGGLRAMLALLGGPVGAIITAAGAAYIFRKEIIAWYAPVKAAEDRLGALIAKQKELKELQTRDPLETIQEDIGTAREAAIAAYSEELERLYIKMEVLENNTGFVGFFNRASTAIIDLSAKMMGLPTRLEAVHAEFNRIADSMDKLKFDRMMEEIEAVLELDTTLKIEVPGEVSESITKIVAKLKEQKKEYELAAKSGMDYARAQFSVSVAGDAAAIALYDEVEAQKAANAARVSAKAEIEKLIEAGRKQREELGKTSLEILKMGEAYRAASPSQQAAIVEAHRFNEALEALNATLARNDAREANYRSLQETRVALENELAAVMAGKEAHEAYTRSIAIETQFRKDLEAGLVENEESYRAQLAAIYDLNQEIEVFKNQADPVREQWVEALKRVDAAFVDLWKSAFSGFKDFGKALKDAFIQLLAELAHRATTQKILISLGLNANTTGGGSGGGFSLGSALNLGTLVKTSTKVWEGIKGLASGKGFSGFAGIFGSGTGYSAAHMSNAAFEQSVLQHGLSGTYTNSLGLTQTQMANLTKFADAAGPWLAGLGGAIAGYQTGNPANAVTGAVGGFVGYKAGAALGAKLGSVVPGIGNIIGAVVGAVIGGLASNIFSGSWQDRRAGITLGFDEDGFAPQDWIRQTKSGGLFSSSKRRYKDSPMEGELNDVLGMAYESTVSGIGDLYRAIGVAVEDADLFSVRQAALRINISDQTEEEVQKQIDEWFIGLTESLVKSIDPNMTVERLSLLEGSLTTVNGMFQAMGLRMYDVSLAGAEMALKLIEISEGYEAFASAADFYYQNFYTEQERAQFQVDQYAAIIRSFNKEFETAIKGKDDLRAFVEALDLTTDSGQAAYVAAMNLAPALVGLDQAMAILEQGTVDLGDAIQEIAYDTTNLRNMFGDTYERIMLDGIKSEQEKYEYFKTQADAISGIMQHLVEPSQIEAAMDQYLQLAGRAYDALGDESQDSIREELLATIAEVRARAVESIENPQGAENAIGDMQLVLNEMITHIAEAESNRNSSDQALRNDFQVLVQQFLMVIQQLGMTIESLPDSFQVMIRPSEVN